MEIVDYYLERARAGDVENAFHRLRALPHDALPAMQSAFANEADPEIRELILQAIGQHRQPSTIPFFAGALRDTDPRVWKEALDGLVTLASSEALLSLKSARDREPDPEIRAWIEEAIEQTKEALARRAGP
ncbi:HEAT repeat domain-containing protein [Singulisphaera sp. PoT]|uniref:HEAT repeat domain-containing protein n=1 Tax=Singulisphaera sp. PoT TaxID=3411797 RepID=UPI003BF5452A